jgi:ubiquitin-conjugating enzyme E2 S
MTLNLAQNSSTLRRLASDQASLRRATPPNYLFPPSSDVSSLPDDLTQLTILVTGAQGTAYSQGLWRLHLSMPDDYPKNPPKATFKTRIYHPNVDESSGAVCLDTLKKDWRSKLTLRDILIVY